MANQTIDMTRVRTFCETSECSEYIPSLEYATKDKTELDTHLAIIVANDPDVLCRLRYVLMSEDYRVIESVNIDDALEAVKNNLPSMVIVNNALPEVNGTRFLYRVEHIVSATTRVLLTDHLDRELVSALRSKVVSLCMTRPFEDDKLRKSLRLLPRNFCLLP